MKTPVTVKEAARRLGTSEQFVRIAMQRGALPIGAAVQMRGKQYAYYINPQMLDNYINGRTQNNG